MKKLKVIIAAFLSTLLISCMSTDTIKKGETDAAKPVNCATAEADIRILQSEKAHVSQQIAAGATAIIPISLVINLVTRTEGDKIEVATGKYNEMLDDKIAEIQRECGLK